MRVHMAARVRLHSILGVLLLAGLLLPLGGRPAVAADTPSGQIAYVTGGNIWLRDVATGQATQLTTDGQSDYPTWSADGEWLAFASQRNGNSDIYRMHADGSAVTRLTIDSHDDILPAYAPGGTLFFVRILLEWHGPNQDNGPFHGEYDVIKRTAAGQESVVYSYGQVTCYRPVGLSARSDTELALSDDCQLGINVRVLPLPAKEATEDDIDYRFQPRLDQHYCEPGLKAQQAYEGQWAHTKAALAFVGDGDCAAAGVQGYSNGLYILPYDTLKADPVLVYATKTASLAAPAWSPDDTWLVFQQDDGLALISAQGGTPQPFVAAGTRPAWRPGDTGLPGMPVTGQPDTDWLLLALLLASGALLAGRTLRRARA